MERLKARGVQILSAPRPTLFDEDWYDIASADHFWIEWRLKVLLQLLKDRRLSTDAPLRVLDIGGGIGIFRSQLEKAARWSVDLAELNGKALEQAKPGRGKTCYYDILQQDARMIGSYDVVFVFDVLEHLSQPIPFLKASTAHLKAGGALLINVPALEWCRSAYDTVIGHLRRYDTDLLKSEVRALPLTDVEMRYWGLSLLPALLLRKGLLRFKDDPKEIIDIGFRPPSTVVSRMMKALLRLETSMIKHPPLGSSLMLCARKRMVP